MLRSNKKKQAILTDHVSSFEDTAAVLHFLSTQQYGNHQ